MLCLSILETYVTASAALMPCGPQSFRGSTGILWWPKHFSVLPFVLPDIVFSNLQIILDKVTELVHFSYCLQGSSPPVALEGKWLQFRDKGIVTLEMFQDERFSTHYIQDLFTPADLIKLFKHLLIVAPLSSTKYFMPSLLWTISLEKVRKQLPLPSITVGPSHVYFPAGCAQNGVFCALVVYLLTKYQWKFAKVVPWMCLT